MLRSLTVTGKILILTIVSFIFSQCGNQQEGCTDPLAVNFDVSAEKNCCCRFPSVILNYGFQYDGMPYNIGNANSNGDTLLDAEGNAFVVRNIRLLFSDFVINKEGAEPHVFDKRLKAYIAGTGDSILTIDDYAAISFTNTMVTTFTYKAPLILHSLDFKSGATDSAYLFDPLRITTVNHPLYRVRGNFYDSTSMQYQAAIIEILTLKDSTLRTFRVAKPDDSAYHIGLNDFPVKPGFDLRIDLNINFNRLFEGINWDTADQAIIRERIRKNLPFIFGS